MGAGISTRRMQRPKRSNAPRRLQRKRTAGARLPEGAVCVTRPGMWGNPFVPGESLDARVGTKVTAGLVISAPLAVELFRALLKTRRSVASGVNLEPLRGRSLACWCKLCPKHVHGKRLGIRCNDCAPCHADVLLEEANA